MKVLVLGASGYLGWPTCMYLSERGHEVAGVDSEVKRRWEYQNGISPLLPTPTVNERIDKWFEVTDGDIIQFFNCDISFNNEELYRIFDEFQPEAVIHYAEQPSAPYSHLGLRQTKETMTNNINGTLNTLFAVMHYNPDCHIIKLGTMGEYGTPNIDIEEGWLDVEHLGRKDRVLYPKKPGSFYHLSKVADSNNLEYACRVWNIRCTDLNQGVVYGVETDETEIDDALHTSFHYDGIFGTAINRFVTQAACGRNLTVYGNGSQTRGFLNIKDTLRCVELALLNEAKRGEFRVFNQFTEQFSIGELARMVQTASRYLGLETAIEHLDNPRVEQEDHYYNARNLGLPALGLEPNLLSIKVLQDMIELVSEHKEKIKLNTLDNSPMWKR